MASHWYVLRIKPHKEWTVYNLLQNEDKLNVYFPSIRVKPKNPRASKVRPYFPGYMFVQVDLENQGDNALRWTPGTHGLVRFGDEPAVVPEHFILELRKQLARIEAEAERPQPPLRKGDRVRIVSGPFAGYEGIFDTQLSGRDRVQILLAFLNSTPQRLRLNLDAIEKVRQ